MDLRDATLMVLTESAGQPVVASLDPLRASVSPPR